MKTPKRTRAFVSQFVTSQACKNARARYKRKNRVAQLKRTIARLTDELSRERERCAFLHAAYASLAEFARNAKQATLPCTDAEQLETRKGN